MEPLSLSTYHPKLKSALLLCPNNEDQVKRAFDVFMDLCEAKTWMNVELHHCPPLDIVFVSARPEHGRPRTIFVVCDAHEEMSPRDLQSYFQHVRLNDKETQSLTLAMCTVDTSIVYYRVSNSLQPPDPPEVSEVKRQTRRQRTQDRRQHVHNQTERFRKEREQSTEHNSAPIDSL